MAPTLAPLGLQAADLDTIVRDVTDPAAVDQAVRGCEAALLQPNGQTLTRDSPPGRPPGPCCGSKAEAERVARRYREADAPMASRPARDHLSPSVGHSLQVSISAANGAGRRLWSEPERRPGRLHGLVDHSQHQLNGSVSL